MRVLITGADGQVARAVAQELRDAGHDVTVYSRAALDITRAADVWATVVRERPDAVVNGSAYNGVDAAETDRDTVFAVNAAGPAALAEAADRFGAAFVHYSSDFVFDGEATTPYREDDEPNPVNVYGLSKLAGERAAARARRHYVLRLESVFGRKPGGRSTIDRLAEGLIRGQLVNACLDRIVTPSYTADVARATRRLLEEEAPAGLYHCVTSGCCTWYELAEEIARLLGVVPNLMAVRSDDIPLPARRPRYCALSNAKLAGVGIRMPAWQDALAQHLSDWVPSARPRPAVVFTPPSADKSAVA
ncbi:MAG TPA: dTDP-4-dehydrorhamnose reductase [Vicinamibacterales bacterium]|nr:dTDP-4-dehydrorhamnose reductase [Vicinamibacterales bacterium]